MAMVTAVLAVVFMSVYFSVQRNAEALSQEVLHRVIQDSDTLYVSGGDNNVYRADGIFRPDLSITIGGDRVLLPYFTVEVWGNNAYVTGGTYANLDDTEALSQILKDCLSQPQQEGIVEDYGLRYLRQDNGLYQNIAFVDMSMESTMLNRLMRSYLLIVLAALVLLLGVSILLSRWATAPVEKAWRQQRQFLSDASHELKTPLTVILSNAELLEAAPMDQRPARWRDNILSEAKQMKVLVEQMLTLARADNNPTPSASAMEAVSLSDLATDCALAFEPVAFEAGKPLEYDIAPDLTVTGERDKLRRLISILLDNAIKYGADGGTIFLKLQKTDDRHAQLVVSNPGEPIPQDKLPHLFERFYRADDSRGEKSGFGLGLSIAATVAQEHKASLRAESDWDSTRFLFTISLRR